MKYVLKIPFVILFMANMIINLLKLICSIIVICPFALIFIILSLFNKEYFWDKLWCNFIDELTDFEIIGG